MADATSPTTGRCYGVARVCHVWEVPGSSFYAARQAGADDTTGKSSPARRGPEPAISDQDLLAAIRADLARSPWTGEGHRKVWARLRTLDGIQVSRKRVLRLMRQHALLSPHRARTRPETSHKRHIITEAPNPMWATDATQITTVADGKVWLFGVAEHWNAERPRRGSVGSGVPHDVFEVARQRRVPPCPARTCPVKRLTCGQPIARRARYS